MNLCIDTNKRANKIKMKQIRRQLEKCVGIKIKIKDKKGKQEMGANQRLQTTKKK